MSGLTQEELSQRSGLTARGIRHLEAGGTRHPRFHTIDMLARAMELGDADRLRLLNAARPELEQSTPDPAAVARSSPAGDSRRRTVTLPVPMTPFVGRGSEREAIRQMLIDDHAGLLTITGAPGIGKTRLAIEAGRVIAPHYEGNVWFVSLAPLSDPSRMIPVIIETIGASIPRSEGTLDDLAPAIGQAKMLLVLDNMEHLLEAATCLPELLGRCPNLQIVVTSRGRLRVSGERHLPIGPLGVPENDQPSDHRDRLSDAEILFQLHARAVDPHIIQGGRSIPQVAAICRRLDGLPLAIELAAAQLGERSIDNLTAHIDQLLPILEGGPRDQPERLQTMTNSLEWSYSLFAPDEQRLLRFLSVFRGGFTRASASIVASSSEADAPTVEQALSRLVEKSLVARAAGETSNERLMMLEVIREFAGRKLDQGRERAIAEAAHAKHFLALAVGNALHNWIPTEPRLPVEFELELPNVRKSMLWLETAGEHDQMLDMAASLRWFWTSRVDLSEGVMWLERALAQASGEASPIRAKALLALGQVHLYRGDLEQARILYQQAFDMAIGVRDDVEIASSGSSVAALACQEGHYELGRTRCEQALAATGRITDPELAQAIAFWIPGTLARAEHGLGNLDRADEHFRTGAEQFLARGHARGAARVLGAWGTLAADTGDLHTAFERYHQALQHAVRSRETRWIVFNVKMLSAVLAQMGRYDEAGSLQSAVTAFEERYGDAFMTSPMDRRVVEKGRTALQNGGSTRVDSVPPLANPSALLDSATALALELELSR